MKWLPNALTILRCILAFVVGWAILHTKFGVIEIHLFSKPSSPELFAHDWAGWPVLIFTFAACLDYVDGAVARALDAESEFGAVLDPLADKLLVGIALIALSYRFDWYWLFLIPTLLIVGRDIFVTALRHRKGGKLPVSRLAKHKTAMAMIGVGGLLFTFGAHAFGVSSEAANLIGYPALAALYASAAFSLYTGYQYTRSAISKLTP